MVGSISIKKDPNQFKKILSHLATTQLTKPSKKRGEMKISILVILVLLNSTIQFRTVSSTCETNMVSNNIQNEGRKFHLKDSRNNQYLIIESNTKLLRTVSSADFEHFKQNEITWFTACNNYTPIYEDNSTLFEVCIAGLDDKRLFFDEILGIFMFVNPYYQTSHLLLMNMRLVQNVRTNSFEFASFSCHRGYLQLENNFIGIGTKTLLSIEE